MGARVGRVWVGNGRVRGGTGNGGYGGLGLILGLFRAIRAHIRAI